MSSCIMNLLNTFLDWKSKIHSFKDLMVYHVQSANKECLPYLLLAPLPVI